MAQPSRVLSILRSENIPTIMGNTDLVYSTTSESDLHGFFARLSVDIGAGGHTHLQMMRRDGNLTLLNPGSVGAPRDNRHAEYAIIHVTENKLGIELRQIDVSLMVWRGPWRNGSFRKAAW
jgi:predicted phosphodiesterase